MTISTRRHRLARRAQHDAMDLVTDVRDLAPTAVWQRLDGWAAHDRARLLATVVALAAMVDPDKPVSELLGWTDTLKEVA